MERQATLMDATEALFAKAKKGDRAAFDALVDRFHVRLGAFVESRLGDHLRSKVGVEDVLQDAYLRAFQSIGSLRWKSEQAFYSWLANTAEHLILYTVQKYRRDRAPLKKDLVSAAPSPSTARRRRERFERLRAALSGLDPDHQLVIRLARLERLRMREIAERMNRSEEAVRQLLARALRKLKAGFGDTESLHLPDSRLPNGEGANAGG